MTRKEAIDILMSANVWNDKERTALEVLIPELRESEDERIRKELIAAIDEGRVFDIDKEVADRWTAYLEKQKEQKPVLKFSVGDYVIDTNYKGEPLYQIVYIDKECYICEYRGDKEMGDRAVMHFAFDNPYLRLKQKPAEWSEEDKLTIADLINYFEGDSLECSTEEMVQRIKSLRPSWKPSEEQIYSLGTVVKGYNECTVGSVGYHLKELYEQLKKLM